MSIWIELDKIQFWEDNPNESDVGSICESIDTYGYNDVIGMWQEQITKHGNHRVIALRKKLLNGWLPDQRSACIKKEGGKWFIEAIDISWMDKATSDGFGLAMNRTARLGRDDPVKLAALLAKLGAENKRLVLGAGYDADAVKDIMRQVSDIQGKGGKQDRSSAIVRADELAAKWGVAPGQLWRIASVTSAGDAHYLLCGDSFNETDRARLLACANQPINIMHADPPYGIDVVGRGNRALGKSKLYAPVEGDDRPFDPAPFLSIGEYKIFWGANHYANLLSNSPFWLVWDKQGGAKDIDHASCEMAWCSARKPARVLTHIWDGFRRDSEKDTDRLHPTQKPIAVIEWALGWLDGSLIFDPFVGSGVSLLAAENMGRRVLGMEIMPGYCAVTLERLAEIGLKPEMIAEGVAV